MISKVKLALALLLAAAAAPTPIAAEEGVIIVSVAPQASVRSEAVTLADIGTVKGGASALAAELSRLRIAVSPLPGSWRELDREIISSKLMLSGFGPPRVRLVCPPVVRIYRESQTVSQGFLESRLREYIHVNAPWSLDEMEIDSVSRVGDAVIPAGELAVNIRPRGSSSFLGPMPFSVELIVDGKVVRQIVMQAQISVYRDVVVAAVQVPARQTIGAADVELRRVNISSVRGRTFSSIDQVEGMASTIFLQPNQVLTARNLAQPILVRRGETIFLEASRPGFVIHTTGIAQKDGRRGEIIGVLNPNSRKVVEAQVTGRQRAKVIF